MKKTVHFFVFIIALSGGLLCASKKTQKIKENFKWKLLKAQLLRIKELSCRLIEYKSIAGKETSLYWDLEDQLKRTQEI